jgi:hypothetical protein
MSVTNYGENYGAWVALSQHFGMDRVIAKIEVFPTEMVLDEPGQSDANFYMAGNNLLVEILMRDGWKISVRDGEGRVTDMRRAN